jgi:starch synthase (maltosyl-transferring)
VSELATSEEKEYFRANFFVNTPDILTEELQIGGLPKFRSRLILAATLSPSYGIYSGFEDGENVAAAPGSEEYLDSEKFEVKKRSLDGPLLPLIAKLNHIRREHEAFQHFDDIRFLETENDALIAYAKSFAGDTVVCVVNLDPVFVQVGVTVVPADLGLPPMFEVIDLLTGDQFTWQTGRNYVRLDPGDCPAHLLHVAQN